MPRATARSTEDVPKSPKKVTAKKRAPRKTPARKTAAKKTAARKAPAKKVAKTTTTKRAPAAKTANRKAPTTIPTTRKGGVSKTQKIVIGISAFLLLASGGASAAIGMSDTGVIDVDQIIDTTYEARAERMANGNEGGVVTIPKATVSRNVPDGGLRGLGKSTPTAAAPLPVSTTTASSTGAGATSTPAIAEEAVEENNEPPAASTTTSST